MKLANLTMLSAAIAIAGCTTLPYEPQAREVKKRPQEGGVIALNASFRPEDRARADLLMQSNCAGSTVKVLEEGEIVVGEKTDSTARRATDPYASSGFTVGGVRFGSSPSTDSTQQVSSSTTQLKEWHLTYQCVASRTAVEPVAKKSKKAKQ